MAVKKKKPRNATQKQITAQKRRRTINARMGRRPKK